MLPVSIAVINPNSSGSSPRPSPTTSVPWPAPHRPGFHTGPATSPPSINNAIHAVQSASHTFIALISASGSADASSTSTSASASASPPADEAGAFLVCCFSNHPLAAMLRHAYPSKPCMHILEAAVLHALPLCTRFGVITTGADAVPDIDRGVRDVLGANSYRYIGTLATGLGVVELQTGDQRKVAATLREYAAKLAEMGADAIILGCAGMTGMEAIVREGAQSALRPGKQVAVIDGAKAGVQPLAGLTRCQYFG